MDELKIGGTEWRAIVEATVDRYAGKDAGVQEAACRRIEATFGPVAGAKARELFAAKAKKPEQAKNDWLNRLLAEAVAKARTKPEPEPKLEPEEEPKREEKPEEAEEPEYVEDEPKVAAAFSALKPD